MAENRISASLSQTDRQDVMAAITTIRQKLPFLYAQETGLSQSRGGLVKWEK